MRVFLIAMISYAGFKLLKKTQCEKARLNYEVTKAYSTFLWVKWSDTDKEPKKQAWDCVSWEEMKAFNQHFFNQNKDNL